jgi:glutaredoxin 3
MKLYVKPYCPWCVDAVAWLRERGIAFTLIDVLSDAAGYARMRQISGQSLTPTLEMEDGRVLADFDTRQLDRFWQDQGKADA